MLPFTLLAAIFGIAWEHLSLFGAAILYLGILNTALGRKVRTDDRSVHASQTHMPTSSHPLTTIPHTHPQ